MSDAILTKAADLVKNSDLFVLASVGESGFPRMRVMVKNRADGLATIWATTGLQSQKVADFSKNPKAGICVSSDNGSVTLMGNVQVICDTAAKREFWQEDYLQYFPGGIDDPNYCVLRFDTAEIVCHIGSESFSGQIDH
jgi:general stress protein 26